MDILWQPHQKSRMASILETVSMIAEFGQKQWSYTNFRLSDRTLRSRDSTGETPPIKAERPDLGSHLGSTCLRGSTSMRIWTRAFQPDQEEVSSCRFRRAQIVSGRQTFPPIFWLGAEIFARPGDFNARQGSIVRLYFYQTPIFCIPAVILGCAYNTRQCFGHPPIFQAFANIFMRRLDFRHPPIF